MSYGMQGSSGWDSVYGEVTWALDPSGAISRTSGQVLSASIEAAFTFWADVLNLDLGQTKRTSAPSVDVFLAQMDEDLSDPVGSLGPLGLTSAQDQAWSSTGDLGLSLFSQAVTEIGILLRTPEIPMPDGSGGGSPVVFSTVVGTTAPANPVLSTEDIFQGDNSRDVADWSAKTNAVAMYGESGRDTLHGGEAGDQIDGGEGHDLLYGNAGDDNISGGRGHDDIWAGDGNDTVSTGKGRDTAYGGTGDDVMSASAGRNFLYGEAGNDTLTATGGRSTIFGGDGDDILIGSGGSNTLNGGDGIDVLRANGGKNTLNGGAGDDVLFGGGDRTNMDGGAGADVLTGGDGRDIMEGGQDDDRLVGNGQNDKLRGGNGNDWIHGGEGKDVLTGGAGADTFYFGTEEAADSAFDIFTDFTSGEDTLVFDGAAFGLGANITADEITFGQEADSADTRLIYDAQRGRLYWDADGTGAAEAEMIARMNQRSDLAFEDFELL